MTDDTEMRWLVMNNIKWRNYKVCQMLKQSSVFTSPLKCIYPPLVRNIIASKSVIFPCFGFISRLPWRKRQLRFLIASCLYQQWKKSTQVSKHKKIWSFFCIFLENEWSNMPLFSSSSEQNTVIPGWIIVIGFSNKPVLISIYLCFSRLQNKY